MVVMCEWISSPRHDLSHTEGSTPIRQFFAPITRIGSYSSPSAIGMGRDVDACVCGSKQVRREGSKRVEKEMKHIPVYVCHSSCALFYRCIVL